METCVEKQLGFAGSCGFSAKLTSRFLLFMMVETLY